MTTEQTAKEREQARRAALAAGLRDLAEAIDSSPRFPIPDWDVNLSVSADVWEYDTPDGRYAQDAEYHQNPEKSLAKLRRLVSGLGRGKKDKHYSGSSFTCTKQFGPHVSVRVEASRAAVCKKVPTGRVIVHPASVIPERTEEEFEWVCDETLLGGPKKEQEVTA